MKKLGIFVMPLMAVSLLASCGGKNFNRWYTYEDWWNYCSNGNLDIEATIDDVGKIVPLTVNGQAHEVRLIDVDKDVDKDNKKIHTTFEFVDLISDESGFSLATQWNDTNDDIAANHDYLNSSIRKALTNEGDGHILWAQKGETAWSTKDDYIKPILEMLPKELTDVLIAPQKTVQCYESGDWTDKPITNNSGEYDKLFLLSPEEMGSDANRIGAYTYYQEPNDAKLNCLRIKRQVNDIEFSSISSEISDSRQTYQGIVFSYAGFNSGREDFGGYSWLRSPYIGSNNYASNVYSDGCLYYSDIVYVYANGVAPAFCI